MNGKVYKMEHLISEGGYGFVYKVVHNKEAFALKRMILQEEERLELARKEALLWEKLG